MPALVSVPEQKKVTISSKRQFTIPQKFFTELGFDKEAVCTLGKGMLIIEPIHNGDSGEFAEEILSDLIAEGYSGQKLLAEFKIRQGKIRPAVERMLKAAEDAANGLGDHYTYEDLFGGNTK